MAHGCRLLLNGWRLKEGLGCERARWEFMEQHFPDRACKLIFFGDDKETILRLVWYCVMLGG